MSYTQTKPKSPQNKSEVREELVNELMPVIKNLAYKMSFGFNDPDLMDELISAGVLGLLESYERFIPKLGTKLSTFAYLRIKGAMIDELRSRGWTTRTQHAKVKQIEKVINQLENNLGRHPDEQEIVDFMGIDIDHYHSMLKNIINVKILNIDEIFEIAGEEKDKVVQYITDNTESPDDFVYLKQIKSILAKEIDNLPEKQKMVLSLYYHEELNMKEVASVLGITEARVCQIHTQAILNLRVSLKREINFNM